MCVLIFFVCLPRLCCLWMDESMGICVTVRRRAKDDTHTVRREVRAHSFAPGGRMKKSDHPSPWDPRSHPIPSHPIHPIAEPMPVSPYISPNNRLPGC